MKDQFQGYLLTVRTRNVYERAENLDLLQADMGAEIIPEDWRLIKLENERNSGYVHIKNQLNDIKSNTGERINNEGQNRNFQSNNTNSQHF